MGWSDLRKSTCEKNIRGVQENDEKDLGEIDKNVSERVKVEKSRA